MSQERSKKQPKSPLRKKIGMFIYMCIVTAFIGAAGFGYFATNYYKSTGPLQTQTTVVIPSGHSVKYISRLLAKNNVIKYPELFTMMIRVSKSGNRMKAGEYLFTPGMAPAQVFGKIASGDVVTHSIMIPEGLMTSQILQIIKNTPNMTGEVPDDIKEGDLLPETYEYTYGYERTKFVNNMKKAMQQELNKAWEKRSENLPFISEVEALTLASIVEKETGISSERERVAAVFVNRLRKGMRLQTDPTVIYAITKGQYVLNRPLIYKDLEIQDPYHTYRNNGLPPTPIANPGKAAIEAALNPANTNELYFVADGTGGHKFSSTLKEHNENVQNWRKLNKEQKNQSTKVQ